jgi:hypothetical protein
VLALLWDARVVHDPSDDTAVALHLVQDLLPGDAQERHVVPWGVRDEVVHGLVPRLDMEGVHSGGHGLDALAFTIQT